MFLQSLDLRYYRDDELPDRVGAAAPLALPVDYLAVGEHMRALLARLRPDARCAVVRNAVDKSVFGAAEPRTEPGPLRVLVEGQPTLWFKGIDEAIGAVRAMREPATVTLVAQEPARAGDRGADRVVGGLEAAEMRDLYAEHDVLLKLSRFEGFGLPVLEAFHVGRPCVVAPYAGHDELVRHAENGLVVGFDDTQGTAAALDALARDRELRDRLGRGALATAADWPDAPAAGDAFAAALEAFAAEPPPPPDAALRSLARLRRLGAELVRAVDETHEWERVRQHEAYVAELEDRERRIAEVDGWLRLANERLEAVQASRAYRLVLLGRRAMFWRGRDG